MKPPAPLNYVRSFESAARHLSFTAAAKELGYTQAAVSTHVRGLEHYLGRQLFIRYPRSLKLTEMGEAYLPTLREALEQIDQATDAILTSSRKRTVVVSCPLSLAENWLAACLAEFRVTNPEIEVVLHGTIWEDPAEPVADITISTRRFDDQPAGSQPLWNESLVLLCAPSLLEGADAAQTSEDMFRRDWIFIHGRQEYWHAVADAHGLPIADYPKGMTTNSTNIALELAAAGAGLVVAPHSLATTYQQRGLLVEPFDKRAASPWTYYLTEGPLAKGAVARSVRDWILAQASRHSAG